jgi:hypothetical protein
MTVVQQRFAGHGLAARRDGVKPVGPLHDETGGLENLEMFAAHIHAASGDSGEFGHAHDLAGAQRAEHPPAYEMAEGGHQQFMVGQRPCWVGLSRNDDGFHAILLENQCILLVWH